MMFNKVLFNVLHSMLLSKLEIFSNYRKFLKSLIKVLKVILCQLSKLMSTFKLRCEEVF